MSKYACYFGMAQSSDPLVSLSYLIEILITCQNPEMARNSNHFASNSISVRILSHLKIFELIKVSHLRKKACDQYFEQKLERN